MNPLQRRLAALRRRLRLVVGVRGFCVTLATFLAGMFLAAACDALFFGFLGVETWPILRAALLAGILTLTGIVSYLLLIRPFAAPADDLSLALRVEEQYPILNDALASTVQFLEQAGAVAALAAPNLPPSGNELGGDTPKETGTSSSLRQEAIQRALRLAQGCDFAKAVSGRGLRLSAALLLAIVVLALPFLLLRPAVAMKALVRVGDPFGDHPWTGTQTALSVTFPGFLAIGQPLVIAGEVRGVVPAKATIEFDEATAARRQVDIKDHGDGHGTFLTAGMTTPSYRREIRFRVWAGDAVSPKQPGTWHTVALRQPPQLASLNGKPSPQITVRQPRYTDLDEFVMLPPGTGNLDILAGSQVAFQAATTRPIARAWIEFKPLLPGAKEGLLFAAFGPRHPLDVVCTHALANSVWGRVPAVFGPSGDKFSIHFVPTVSGAYVLTVQDDYGLSKSYEYDLNIRLDPAPVVHLLRPSVSQSVLANAELTLQIMAHDEMFALRTVFLEYRRKDKFGQWLEAAPKRKYFYDEAQAETGLGQILTFFAAAPWPFPAPRLHLRPKQLLITRPLSLRGLAIEGETLVIQAGAEDFNDVSAFPQAGHSHEIELKIVGKTALAAVLDEQEARIQQQLLKVRDMQDKAINRVIGAEQHWRATGKLRPDDVVELAEAEQLQREIQARIGDNKDDGLRGELAQLEQMLKDNKLPQSEVAQRIKALREELERVAREHVPKIEPGLTKARRELEAPEQPKIPDRKQAGDLGEARAEQEKVHQALDELLKFMEDRSTFQQIKGELRAILREQQDRENEVAKLQDAVAKLGEGALQENNQLKADLRRTAELQRRLADRAERLIEQLNDFSKKMDQTDPAVAEMLERAAKIAGPINQGGEAVVNAMRDIAVVQLRDDFDQRAAAKSKAAKTPNLDTARSTQGDVIANLEKMLEALDQTRADEVERLIVRQKKEVRQLNELAAKLEQLQEQIEAAKKIPDANQREAVLKKVGDQLRELQRQAEENARDLGRVQAADAAKELREAARKMERVLRQLERGEEPDESLRQAQDQIDAAKDSLREAGELAEEELSRERIVKIVDRLKGLQERQNAARAESDRLRKEFLQRSNWTNPTVLSLGQLKATQDGIAGETGFFKDKLKGAKVFHALLDRSQQDMNQAAKKVEEWQTKANQHRAPKKLTDQEFAEEKALYESAIKLQSGAAERLQRLIDALLPELGPPKDEPKQAEPEPAGKEPAGDSPKKTGGLRAQDGIPSVAQLKALKAEQLEVNARTKEFAEQHPDIDRLTDTQRTELEGIRAEQDRLLQLFRELITSARADGGKL